MCLLCRFCEGTVSLWSPFVVTRSHTSFKAFYYALNINNGDKPCLIFLYNAKKQILLQERMHS